MSFNTFLCTAKGSDKKSESTTDLNRGGRMQSIGVDKAKASVGGTFNQTETAACGYELNNNIACGKSDVACRIEEDDSKVLNQELSSESKSTLNKRKNSTSKVTGDSAEKSTNSSNEKTEGINSSKGACFESK